MKKLYARTQHHIVEIPKSEYEIGDTLYWEDNFKQYDYEEIIAISDNILDLVLFTDLLGVEWYCGFAIEWIGSDTAKMYVDDIIEKCQNGDDKITKLYIKQRDENYILFAEDKGKGELELL